MPYIHKWTDSAIYTACASETGWALSRRAWEMLHFPLQEDQTRSFPLEIPGRNLSLIQACMDPQIWASLPLQDHKILEPALSDIEMLRKAFNHLDTHHPDLMAETAGFLQAVALVDLKEKRKSDATCVTSVSIPDLPFCSFLSQRALFHIPPNILVRSPDIAFLEENLYHESIHHRVSLNLLEKEVFQEDYHSQLSPKISIPWREGGLSRIKFWELDRVFHAFNVYVALLPYRAREAWRQPDSPWSAYVSQALACTQFLGKILWVHKHVLTELGRSYVLKQWASLEPYVQHVEKIEALEAA